jgi:hypothetical protein
MGGRIVVVDALGIGEHAIDGGIIVFLFARAYTTTAARQRRMSAGRRK